MIPDPSLPSIDLGIEENRNMLWGKTKAAFKYVYENYRWEKLTYDLANTNISMSEFLLETWEIGL